MIISKGFHMWECKHLHRHTWEEEVANAATFHVSFSCTYYWQNPRLIKDFVSQYGRLRYYWGFSFEGQMERKRIEGERSPGLSGVSGPPIDHINAYNQNFYKSSDSKNFPYDFNPNIVCMGCKNFLK